MARKKKPLNAGHQFEADVAAQGLRYMEAGQMVIRKCDPPSITFMIHGKPITKLKESPFLDFVGLLVGGQSVMFETKHTVEPRLPVGDAGKFFKDSQIRAMWEWDSFGAVSFVLWRHAGEVRILWPETIDEVMGTGRKSVPWLKGELVDGLDFLPNVLARVKKSASFLK